MKLKNLATTTMLAISADWLRPGEVRDLLEAKPLIRALMPMLESAHNDLAVARECLGEVKKKCQALTIELARLDVIHDRFASALHAGLDAAIKSADTPEEGEVFVAATARLFPRGLRIVNTSYMEQNGNAIMMAVRLTPELRATLARVDINGKTLNDIADRWVDAAVQIGRLFNEREKYAGDDDETAVTPAKIRDLRNAWIQAVRALEDNTKLIGYDEEARRKIFAVLRSVQATAKGRSKAAKPKDSDNEQDEGKDES